MLNSHYTHSQLPAHDDADADTTSLLQAVEDHLGPIDTWPTYFIHYLFVGTPSPPVVEELTAFFAGNGLPETLAISRL